MARPEIESLLAAVTDPEGGSGNAVDAALALDEVATPADLPDVQAILKATSDENVIGLLSPTVARLGGLPGLPFLLRLLRRAQGSEMDVCHLLSAIADLITAGPSNAAPLVDDLLDSPDSYLRACGVWLAGEIPEHIPCARVLAASLEDDADVRQEALGALAVYPDHEGVYERLVTALDDPDEGIVLTAISSLGKISNPAAIVLLQRFVADPPCGQGDVVDQALAQLRAAK